MNSFLADRRPKNVGRMRVMAEYWRRARVFGVVCLLALAATAGAMILGQSNARAQQGRPAGQPPNLPAGNVENGKIVFSSRQCITCHGDRGQGGTGENAGPQIAAASITLPAFIERVRKPTDAMPPFSDSQVSDAALSDVYAFLKSMAPPAQASTVTAGAGNAQNGKQLYTSAGCYLCHNGEGQGGAGPRLALNSNMMAFAAFVHQCREPSNQMPPYTTKVLSDAQLADIYAFLRSIPKPLEASSIPLLQ